MDIKVSIIIPVYNVESYLEECMESAVNQTLDSIEIIAIDDGSTDNSLNILNKYKRKYDFMKIITQKNKGASAARNRGIKEAVGEYIFFLDSDDYIDLKALEYLYDVASQYKLDILTFDECEFKENDIEKSYDLKILNKSKRQDLLDSNIRNGEDFYNYVNRNRCYRTVIWLCLYKRTFIKENNLYFYEGAVYEDVLYCIQTFILAKSVMYTPKTLYYYRKFRPKSVTTEINEKNVKSCLIIAEECYKFYEKYKNTLKDETIHYILEIVKLKYKLGLMYSEALKNQYWKKKIISSIERRKDDRIMPSNYLEIKDNNKNKTVSLCMIVKNEEKYIARCLESAKPIVNEMIVVDTGSTDKTASIAKKYGAIVKNYEWKNSFAKARNYSINKAKSDWILIMDADEEFSKEDYDKFTNLINTSTKDYHNLQILNYSDESRKNVTKHYTARLIRNNKAYKYVGDIHENLVRNEDLMKEINGYSNEDIRIYHYGYIESVIKDKHKRERNIPLIENEIKKNPKDHKYLFYLGNEYMAMKQYDKALKEYEKVHLNLNKNSSYGHHLIIRMAMCLEYLNKYEEALNIIEEGLDIYPEFVDIEFQRGKIYKSRNEYDKAIQSLKRCIEIGKSPTHIEVANDCHTYRAKTMLADIYYEQGEYKKSLEYINESIMYNKDLSILLYKAGAIFNKMYEDKHVLASNLCRYFKTIDNIPNLLLIINILIEERAYDVALEYIEKGELVDKNEANLKFLKGKVLFYKNKYEESFSELKYLIESNYNNSDNLLKYIKQESILYYFLSGIILSKDKATEAVRYINKIESNFTTDAYNEMYNIIYNNQKKESKIEKRDAQSSLRFTKYMIDELKKVNQLDLVNRI